MLPLLCLLSMHPVFNCCLSFFCGFVRLQSFKAVELSAGDIFTALIAAKSLEKSFLSCVNALCLVIFFNQLLALFSPVLNVGISAEENAR
ncbi:hypothetical protein CZ787_01135 [Halomonas citrativorans]|uniref:Uncharacterized protein n=1 Tax=Halomonas citrativorans TaxID=2742612 RepID=A0A1R4HP13_9GAMM|nr:hypothetical protein [Halomonas citrativorans]SJN09268.1 hypothetical protein CZ787_01135 [Halomonas citrativorans]